MWQYLEQWENFDPEEEEQKVENLRKKEQKNFGNEEGQKLQHLKSWVVYRRHIASVPCQMLGFFHKLLVSLSFYFLVVFVLFG